MIEVKNLVKKYGNHTAVDNLSFKVEKGQVYGFLGPNGAGKSTTMNILIGYLSATEGEVLINGHSIFDEPEEAKKYIGYLPELPPLYLDMTVKEYLKFVAEIKKIPKNKRKQYIEEAMQMTKITEMSGRLIKHLSKGYRQRVGFAQAILGYPEIIILDEPMVGLDPKQIIEIRDLIKKLSKKHTIILSSHILSEISVICDQILIINKGKLVANGTPESLAEINQAMHEVELTVVGKKDSIQEVLKQQTKIRKFEIKASEEQNAFDIIVRCDKAEDIREQLFRAFGKADCPIIRMVSSTKTLEDVFLEMTENDNEIQERNKEKSSVRKKKNGKTLKKEAVPKEVEQEEVKEEVEQKEQEKAERPEEQTDIKQKENKTESEENVNDSNL